MELSPTGEFVPTDAELASEIRLHLERLERQKAYLEDTLTKLEDNNEPLSDIFTDL